MILIERGIVLTMDRNGRIVRDGAIVVEEEKIVAVGRTEDIVKKYGRKDQIIDAKGKIVIPGLINAHDHSAQTLVKSLPCDLPFPIWDKEYMFEVGKYATPEDFYYSALLSYAGMLKMGITSVVDQHFHHENRKNIDSLAKAMKDIGIRGFLTFGFQDKAVPEYLVMSSEDLRQEFDRVYREWNGKAEKRIEVWIGPAGYGMCSEEALKVAVDLSKEYKTRMHTHVSATYTAAMSPLWEVEKTEVEYLRNLEVLGPNTSAVHCVWLTDEDIDILHETRTSVVHSPISNMYLAFGTAPIVKMMRRGINVALGVDGIASHTPDMFEIMRATAYLHKLHLMSAKAIKAYEILKMATINGAKAVGMEDQIGSIEEGKLADLTIIDANKLHMIPYDGTIPAVVYYAKGSDVDTVIVNGKIVVENGRLTTIDEEKLLEEAEKRIKDLWERGEFEKRPRVQ